MILSHFLFCIFGILFALPAVSASPLKIVSTTNIVHDLVREIGGDRIHAKALMQAGIDPHYYRATFGDMRDLGRADAVFYNGLHLEGRMQDVLDNLSAIKPVFAVSDNLEPLIYEGDQVDPHIWLDVSLWRQAANTVRNKLSILHPQHADYFMQRWYAYDKQLAELDNWIREQIQQIPRERRVLISAHNAFGYFGAAYDIEVMGLQGLNTTAEYGLKDISLLKELIKTREIKAVFIESTLPKRSIQALLAGVQAEGHGLKLGGELYTDALGSADSTAATYIAMMRHNTHT